MYIKYFSWVRDQIGVEVDNISISSEIQTVHDLIQHLQTLSDNHKNALANTSILRCAVNMEVVNFDTKINDSDEIALFPPMTGG